MKKNNRRFNYVDLLILIISLTVLSILITVIFKDSSQIDFSQKETVTLTLRIKNIPVRNSGLIKSGDSIYQDGSDELFGTVKYASFDDETVEFLDKLTNTSAIYRAPDKKTALLLVEAMAEYQNNEFIINDCVVKSGEQLLLHSPSLAFEATVVNIENNKD